MSLGGGTLAESFSGTLLQSMDKLGEITAEINVLYEQLAESMRKDIIVIDE